MRQLKKASSAVLAALLWLVSFHLVSLPALPQEKKKELEHQISVSAISIAVTVQDKNGRFITDLTQADFRVYENGVEQNITYFQHDFEAPVSLTILLDVSGSMGLQDKLREGKETLRYLLTELLRPQDEASLLIFADGEVEVAARFSTDKGPLLAELDRTEAYGQTALNDAVAVSPQFANLGKNEKRAILLLTDGIENDSQATVDQAVEIARRVDVPIFTIGYKIPLSEEFLRKHKRSASLTSAGIVSALERFSQATGGKVFIAAQPEDLRASLREVKRELSHQYIIGYTSYKSPKNEYRKIRVETSKKKYRVRTREGY
jgi:VWFA-related protein